MIITIKIYFYMLVPMNKYNNNTFIRRKYSKTELINIDGVQYLSIDRLPRLVSLEKKFNRNKVIQYIKIGNAPRLISVGAMACSCDNLKCVIFGNLSTIKKISGVFQGCINLVRVKIGDLQEVQSVNYLFQSCNLLQDVSIGNMPNVTNMDHAFEGCDTLETINIGQVPNLKSAKHMFGGCKTIRSIDLRSATSLEEADFMFDGCESLQLIKIDTNVLKNIDFMLCGCKSLRSICLGRQQYLKSLHCFTLCCTSLKRVEIYGLTIVDINEFFENIPTSCSVKINGVRCRSRKMSEINQNKVFLVNSIRWYIDTNYLKNPVRLTTLNQNKVFLVKGGNIPALHTLEIKDASEEPTKLDQEMIYLVNGERLLVSNRKMIYPSSRSHIS